MRDGRVYFICGLFQYTVTGGVKSIYGGKNALKKNLKRFAQIADEEIADERLK